jgi:hypothetical protein
MSSDGYFLDLSIDLDLLVEVDFSFEAHTICRTEEEFSGPGFRWEEIG